ncbi:MULTISPECIES: VWA domain-containing protein [unclassified Rhodococcus (in: high G+C Gram-positive bacteria)]|uniref:VWA domain-containing protein n=1 Tax=unclassified Rhodococcus (in: high G+C Gram-positive bacteria) TaxID=192944 RepID=UPI0006FBC418|nr:MULTISPECIES: VWA domain-containing protein [unclassified Rhodococcus (in: high G+C Gram-positive bacteria)]KQU30321.1 hypothetical protein ASG69_04490 [Rhodococcus sp. Leaf225]KQU44774.1 hypothetical protein ASH03_12650 [Rhodococcus sp. Leaf258]
MGTRKGLYGRSHRPADPGVSPNEYVGAITAEVRVHFPPNTDQELVTEAIDEALADALNQLTAHVEEVAAAERRKAERRTVVRAALDRQEPT